MACGLDARQNRDSLESMQCSYISIRQLGRWLPLNKPINRRVILTSGKDRAISIQTGEHRVEIRRFALATVLWVEAKNLLEDASKVRRQRITLPDRR